MHRLRGNKGKEGIAQGNRDSQSSKLVGPWDIPEIMMVERVERKYKLRRMGKIESLGDESI